MCGVQVESDFSLCAGCWRDTPFIGGLTCSLCGTPLPGEEEDEVHCDDCLKIERPWDSGSSVLEYEGKGRAIVLALKHGDRQDLARPAGKWMADVSGKLGLTDPMVAPMPLHRWRLLSRRFNQAALLSNWLARARGWDHLPDLFLRSRATATNKGMSPDARFANLDGAIKISPRHAGVLKGRDLLIVDDVMTSGASLSACAVAARPLSVGRIGVVTLARVAKGR